MLKDYNRLIAFTSYYFATKAEQVLKERGHGIQLIATPPALHNMCGLCIIVMSEELKEIVSLLREEHISHSGVFTYAGPKGHCEKLPHEAYEG